MVSTNVELATAGAFLSYGASMADSYRRVAIYVDKILKGAKPADLPIEQSSKFELIINGKTAAALGIKIPQSLLITAETVLK
jgi:putative ABC transport system substrate-binding protein